MLKGNRDITKRNRERKSGYGVRTVELSKWRQPSLVESFYKQENEVPNGRQKAICWCDEIFMLFNQRRLDRMTAQQLNEWLELSSSQSDGLKSLRSRLKDEQLQQFIKSRYIQSQSELLSYSRELELYASKIEMAELARRENEAMIQAMKEQANQTSASDNASTSGDSGASSGAAAQ